MFLMHSLNTESNLKYMQNLSDGFTCTCPDDFEGTTCQMEANRDHCFPFPCENGGNCTVSVYTQSTVQYCG